MYEIFAKLMNAKGCTAYQVSKATGIAQSTLSDWKSGKSVPKADKIQKIADYFGVSAEYLMTGEEKQETSGYYLDPETAVIAQEIFEKDKVLFDVYKSTDKNRLIEYAKRLKALQDMEERRD